MHRARRVFLLALLLTALAAVLLSSELAAAVHIEHRSGDDYFIVRDEQGRVISMTTLGLGIGDYIITEDNRGYSVSLVKGRDIRAKFDRLINLGQAASIAPGTNMAALARTVAPIATYCTHSGESYVPTSGTDTKNMGDIYKVQDSFAAGMRAKGYSVVESKANFNPHDADAYMRSRRTASRLLTKDRPSVMIDMHRDGIPNASYYRRTVAGEDIAAVRLVVGQQNANRKVNFEFAKQIKATADRVHPHLVREIFWAQGNYNQDLAPRAILMEFGTHLNSAKEAERGARLMADVMSVVLTGTQGNRGVGTTGPNPGRAAGRTVWVVLALVALGAVGFVVLNAGSWDDVKRRFRKFLGNEVGLGPKDDDPEGK